MAELIVEWDENKNAINRRIHHISFETARLVFADPNRIERLDNSLRNSSGEVRWQTLGLVGDGEKKGAVIMAMVTTKVIIGQKPTRKQLAEVELASSFPIVYNEDSPKSSEAAIAEFAELAKKKRNIKTTVTLPISKESISIFKSFNKNYVKVMSGILDYVANHPKTLSKMLS